MGMRVWDAGKSERRAVIARIGVEEISNIIPPEREQDFRLVSPRKRLRRTILRRTGK